jgi:hypothetical protein
MLLPSKAVMKYITAGNATFTLESPTGNRFTYKVTQKSGTEDSPAGPFYFVSVLAGPDNVTDYTYIGYIVHNKFFWGAKSRLSAGVQSVRAFKWFYDRAVKGNVEPVKVYHSGKCGRCGRKLTTPESITMGLGPVCQEFA